MMTVDSDDCPHCGYNRAFRYDEALVETNLECPRCGYFYYGNAEMACQGTLSLSGVNRRRGGGLPLYREGEYSRIRDLYADGPWAEGVMSVSPGEYEQISGPWVSVPLKPVPPHASH